MTDRIGTSEFERLIAHQDDGDRSVVGAVGHDEAYDAMRRAERLLETRRPREAARLVEQVVELEPDHASAWELLGRARFAAALLAPAESAFRRLVELEPTSGWAHTALGLTLDRQSRHREGATFHRMAVAMGEEPARPQLRPMSADSDGTDSDDA